MSKYDAFAPVYAQLSSHMTEDVPDHRIAAELDGVHLEEPVPMTNRYSPAENRVDLELDSGAAVSIVWATKNEWLGLIDVAGFEVEALYGWFDRRPFDDESREYVWVARKPARVPGAPLAVRGRRGQYE